MLEASRLRILDGLTEQEVVLDVGGGSGPFARADWVVDLVGYDARVPVAGERFSRERWIERDVCEREPLPFADDSVDFAICSHTLEDVRDPIWVCAELSRVARAGYVEVPSRLVEQAPGVHGPWTGWSHHRWLVDVDQAAGTIDFVFKSGVVHARERATFPPGSAAGLSPQESVQQLWWRERIRARERILLTAEELDSYLEDFVEAHRVTERASGSRLARLLRRG